MTTPLGHNVNCVECGYVRRTSRMEKVDGGYRCSDRSRCQWNRQERDRLDSWKRGQRR